MKNYLQQFQELLKEHNINQPITLKTDLQKLGIDSLSLMNLIIEVEEKYGILFPDDELLAIKNVGDIITLWKAQIDKKDNDE